MPTFDFSCKKCGTVFEFARPFGSKTVPACPQCGSKRTEKQLSAPTVVFKGEGWYKTDSRKKVVSGTKKEEGKSDTKEVKEIEGNKEIKTTKEVKENKEMKPKK